MGILKDIFDTIGDSPVGDLVDAAFRNLSGRTYTSIHDRAGEGTLQFPHIVSKSLNLSEAQMVCKASERNLATFVQIAMSLSPTLFIEDGTDAYAYIKQFHSNLSSPMSMKGAKNDILSLMVENGYKGFLEKGGKMLVTSTFNGNTRNLEIDNKDQLYCLMEDLNTHILSKPVDAIKIINLDRFQKERERFIMEAKGKRGQKGETLRDRRNDGFRNGINPDDLAYLDFESESEPVPTPEPTPVVTSTSAKASNSSNNTTASNTNTNSNVNNSSGSGGRNNFFRNVRKNSSTYSRNYNDSNRNNNTSSGNNNRNNSDKKGRFSVQKKAPFSPVIINNMPEQKDKKLAAFASKPKDFDVTLNKDMLRDNDVKKANELVSTLVHVRIQLISREHGTLVGYHDFILGVKAIMHPVVSGEIVDNILTAYRGEDDVFDFLRWTTGEIEFMRDLILHVNTIKKDVLLRSAGASPIWLSAKRAKRLAGINNFFNRRKMLPNVVLVVTKEEIAYIKETHGIDFFNLGNVGIIMDKLFLLAFIIVDSAAEAVHFKYDSALDWEVVSYSGLEKENSRDERKFKEMLKALNR